MKKTIAQDLATRKYKRPNKVLWFILVKLIAPFLMRSYGKQYVVAKDKISKVDGPKFIIYNHQSRFDWITVVRAAFPERVNFVIGYNEFFRSKFKLIFKLIHAIPKKNFTMDIPSIKAIKDIISDNGVVCFSPEGMSSITGYNQPIVPGTGKFFKYYGVPVYVLKSKGAYLVNHKVCLDNRKGPVYAELSCLFSKEDLDKYTEEEIQAKIDEAIWQDDYEWNAKEQHHYKTYNNICSHMDDLAYYCPKCGKEFGIVAKGNEIKCEHCGNSCTVDDTYKFIPSEGSVIPVSLSKWVELERCVEIKRIKEDPNYEFVVENCTLGELPKYKYLKNDMTSNPCGSGTVKVNHSGFYFDGVRDGKPFSFYFDYKKFTTLVIVTDCQAFGVYLDGEFLEITPPTKSVGKLLLMVEEFSRFHYNTWPNFPWMSHLYEDK